MKCGAPTASRRDQACLMSQACPCCGPARSVRRRQGRDVPTEPNHLLRHPGPLWRNGRRRGLKIPRPQGRAGSSPASGTRGARKGSSAGTAERAAAGISLPLPRTIGRPDLGEAGTPPVCGRILAHWFPVVALCPTTSYTLGCLRHPRKLPADPTQHLDIPEGCQPGAGG